MSRQVILHVGMPKTGTTSLQRAFAGHTDLLRSHGISYGLPEGQETAHHELARSACGKDTSAVEKYFRQIEDKLEGCDRILISSEAMARLRGDELAWWKACLDGRFRAPDYVIWLFIRRPADQIPSRWHSRIRRGLVQNLPAYAFKEVTRILAEDALPFQRLFDNWAAVFPESSIRVVPMERLVAGDTNFLEDSFKMMFGIAHPPLRAAEHHNKSLPPGQAELLRAMSLRRARTDPATVREFIGPMVKLLRRGDKILGDYAGMFEPLIDHVTINDRCSAFLGMEKAAIERIGSCLQAPDDGSLFGSDSPKPAPYIRDVYWFDESIRRSLDDAYAFAVDRWNRGRSTGVNASAS